LRSCRINLLLALVVAGCAPAPGPGTLAARLGGASEAYRRHRDTDAENLFRAALAEAPATLVGRIRLALAATLLRQRRDDEAARELAAAARELDGAADRSVVRLKATLALHARRLDQAEALFAALAAADALDVQAQVGLACVQVGRGDARGALVFLDRAAALAPRRGLVYYDRALAWDALGERENAVADARTAVTLDPEHVEARTNLAALLARAGRPAEAEAELATAVARFPSSATAHGNLGALLYLRGVPGAAAAELEAAVARAPGLPAFHFDLGLAYFALGDLARARAAFERVLALDPANEGARRNLRFIDAKQRGLIHGDELPAGSIARADVAPSVL